MKKYGLLLLVAVLAITMVASLAGCGDNKAKEDAKGYMMAGDANFDAAVKIYEDMQAAQAEAVTALMGGATTGGDAMIAEMTALADDMMVDLELAEAEYKNILALEGVEDYVTYANVQIDIIEMYRDLLKAASELLASIQATLAAGGTLDVMALMQSPEMQNITTISDEIDRLAKENKAFKSEKKLAE